MHRRTTILIAAVALVVVIAAFFLTGNRTGESENPGQPAPHALDQSN
ncbi:hypothetical protein [Phyllobacterium endophyticum]|jgi:hypothetical protein|nr:hypothetical protein [Phyllobacterium endophyticum]MBB3233840.1 hypothetical protein [Phyllobacterium endophyticum]